MTRLDKFIVVSDDAINDQIESKVPEHFDDTRVIFYQDFLQTEVQNSSYTCPDINHSNIFDN